ncbi:hypothetical protein QW180_02680 [Vibrio sinaloensis]|nr:hypothetical protein [Vibrio sinaloensis]
MIGMQTLKKRTISRAFFGSLKEHDHIDLLNFELKQEHIGLPTQNEIDLDIDFFIRDSRTKKRFTPYNSSTLNRTSRQT